MTKAKTVRRGVKPTPELKRSGAHLAKVTGCPSDRVEDQQSWLVEWQFVEVTGGRIHFSARGAELLLRSWGR